MFSLFVLSGILVIPFGAQRLQSKMQSFKHGSNNTSYSRTITTSQTHKKTVVSVTSLESRSEASHFESMSEKRKAKKVIGRSISLNFNTAHALNLRLRRGHALLSPLQIQHGPHDFRQVFWIRVFLEKSGSQPSTVPSNGEIPPRAGEIFRTLLTLISSRN